MSKDSVLTAAEDTSRRGAGGSATVTAILVPVTEEAQRALGGKPNVRITALPFKVGRESRSPSAVTRIAAAVDRRIRNAPQLNDLYLVEPRSDFGFHVSREHFTIEQGDSGLVLIDRGSACGTRVGDRVVGADSKYTATELRDGDVIVVGTSHSPYVYQFRLSTEEASR